MTDQIFNKIITIKSKEEAKTKTGTNTIIKLKDQDGERFSFFKKKKDGELTSVATQFKNMDLDEGSTVRIGYVKESFEMNGKTIQVNKIINLQETQEKPVVVKQEPTYKSEDSKDDEFWQKRAYKQCLWNYWLEHITNREIKLENWMDEVWRVFNQIDKDADKRFAKGWDKAVAVFGDEPLLPEPPPEEPTVDVSDIPF